MLRLKRYISAVASSNVLDAVLDALAENTRVQVLYIQNFEKGFTDAQLERLTQARARGGRGRAARAVGTRRATRRRRDCPVERRWRTRAPCCARTHALRAPHA